jgi:hypothetical protein
MRHDIHCTYSSRTFYLSGAVEQQFATPEQHISLLVAGLDGQHPKLVLLFLLSMFMCASAPHACVCVCV